jgi:hypothetical protein
MTPWKVTMHCRSNDGGTVADSENRRIIIDPAKTMEVMVFGPQAFSVSITLGATSALTAIVEGIVLINRELVLGNLPAWPAVEICASPVNLRDT